MQDLKNFLKLLADTIFPINCVSCNQEGVWICKSCFDKIPQNTIHYCLNCKHQTALGEFCSNCAPTFHLDKVWIASDFQNKNINKLIKLYKYNFAQDISEFLGFFLLNFLDTQIIKQAKNFKPENIVVIPVPLHNKRLRWRGFNQSEKLAQSIADKLQIKIATDNLQRIKFKKPQASLKKEARLKNIQNVFAWQGDKLNQQNIILVDDVTTTGATLNECAKALKANGANEVWGLVLANG